MDDFVQTRPLAESFQPTQKSSANRIRIGIWVLAALLTLPLALANFKSGGLGELILGPGIILLVSLALDYALRSQYKRDQSPVLLTPDGIESLSFQGKQKSYPWEAITDANVEPIGYSNALLLTLRPGAGANIWFLFKRRKAFIALARYSVPVQEQLLDAVIQRLRLSNPALIATNNLVQERAFKEKLVSLAPQTWGTYALVLINVAAWLFMVIQGADITNPSAETLLLWGGNATSEVQKGQWWRMLSATFLHGGLMHLAMNMVGLWSIGQTVERIYGHRTYLMVYLGSAMTGSALSLHFSAQKAVSVGASGAIFGIAGALLVSVYRHRKTLPKIFGRQNLTGMGIFVFYSLAQGFTQAGIDNGAHVGGLLAGAVMASILPARFDMQRYTATIGRRALLALAAVVGLSASIALSAPPAQVDISGAFASAAALDRGVKYFDQATQLMQQRQKQLKAGQITALELDEKTRTELAPAYRKALVEFSRAKLQPTDARYEFLQEITHLTEILNEALSMNSVVKVGTNTIEPIDPVRAKELETEAMKSHDRLNAIMEKIKQNTANAKKQRP